MRLSRLDARTHTPKGERKGGGICKQGTWEACGRRTKEQGLPFEGSEMEDRKGGKKMMDPSKARADEQGIHGNLKPATSKADF